MDYKKLPRLAQIRLRMAPILKEYGIQALDAIEHTSRDPLILFESRDGSRACPFWLHLPDNHGRGWIGCKMVGNEMCQHNIGTSGWVFVEQTGNGFQERLDYRDGEKALNRIAKTLRDLPPVLQGSHPRKIENANLFETYHALVEALEPYDGIVFGCSRKGGVEALDFVDPCNRVWKITFCEEKAILDVDGDKIELPSGQAARISTAVADDIEYALVTRDAGLK